MCTFIRERFHITITVFEVNSSLVKPPKSLAHTVFRTTNYAKMVSFWQTSLSTYIVHANESITFCVMMLSNTESLSLPYLG